MKTHKLLYVIGIIAFLVACSTKRDTFLNRNFQALNTKYNVNFNGEEAYDKGMLDLTMSENDDFWKTLDVDKTLTLQEIKSLEEEIKRDPNFERAEDKAVSAIQKRSMNIDGSERNYVIDESFLLLGKSRYYENRYIPALEAFNYILYKYPNSNKLGEAKLWREKTNIKLNFNEEAIKELKKLLVMDSLEREKSKGPLAFLKKKGLLSRVARADAFASLSQAYLNKNQSDSAIHVLKHAIDINGDNVKNARYNFILAQIYENKKMPDSATLAYDEIIKMNRNAPKIFAMQAYGKRFLLNDIKADTTESFEVYDKKIADIENRRYLDILYHYRGRSYEKLKHKDLALKAYKKGLKTKGEDKYLTASSYRNVADIYFDDAKFLNASKYYDSTLVFLNERTREFRLIKKKREDLNDVIFYEGVAKENDSLLYVLNLSADDKFAYYQKYVVELEKQDKIFEAEQKRLQQLEEDALYRNPVSNNQIGGGNRGNSDSKGGSAFPSSGGMDFATEKVDVSRNARTPANNNNNNRQTASTNTIGQAGGNSGGFYFYSFNLVENGKSEFVKNWGKRKANTHWSVMALSRSFGDSKEEEENKKEEKELSEEEKEEINLRYDPNFYIARLPKDEEIPQIEKDRNFAYYQLGLIYKEKFKRYPLAAERLEKLLTLNPEERLILPANYNLFKIYEIIDPAKALSFKNKIISQYPNSRYAQILSGSLIDDDDLDSNPRLAYKKVFNTFEKENILEALRLTNLAIEKFEGDEIKPKFELLKATINGRIQGLEAYKNGLEYVFLNYPSSEEGKEASEIFKTNLPLLEKLNYDLTNVKKPKLVYVFNVTDKEGVKALNQKLIKFIGDRKDLKLTEEFFTEKEMFVVLSGAETFDNANNYVAFMEKHKDYLVNKKPMIMSTHNYTVLQLKKNLNHFKTLTTN